MPINRRYMSKDYEHYRVGAFVFAADGNLVIVSKDAGSSILTTGCYEYANHECAVQAAARMAETQSRA